MAVSIFDLVATLSLDDKPFTDGLDKNKEKASGFGGALKSAFFVGAAAVTAATGALTAFGASAVKTGAEFDSSMSQVAATLGLTMSDIANNVGGAGDVFDALSAKAREMGGSTIFSASEAAEGLNILAMSGYDAEKSMSMLEDVLHLAAAGSMDMASSAGYISGAMKGFADESKDAGYYADLMAKGATLANTSVSQLGEAMASGAAGAAAYGQSADSMTVSLLRLAEQGEVGSAAGTALAAAMKNLYTPTSQAQKVLDKLGVSAYNSDGSTRDFNAVVNELNASLAGMTEAEANAYKQTIFGIQGLDAFNKMTVTGIEKQEEWAEALAGASEGIGEAAQQYETMTSNLEGALKGWGSAVDELKISVAEGLTPAISEFVNFGTGAVQRLTEAFKSDGLSGAMDVLGKVVAEGLTMILDKLPEFVDAGFQMLMSLVTGIIENLPAMVDAALEVIVSLATGIVEALPNLVPAIVDVILKIVETLTSPDSFTTLIGAALDIIIALAQGLIMAIPELLKAVPKIIGNLVMTLIGNAVEMVRAATELIAWLLKGISDKFKAIRDKGVEIVQKIKDGIMEMVKNAAQWGKDLVDNFINGITGKFKDLGNAAAGMAKKVKDFIGFSEPEEGPLSNFHTYAPDMMKLFAQGIRDNEHLVTDQIAKSFDFGLGNVSFGGMAGANSMSAMPFGGVQSDIVINLTTEIDGEVLARTTYRYNQDERTRIGEAMVTI